MSDVKLTTDIVIFGTHGDDDQNFKVLLVKRKYDPFAGCWATPGGFIDPGETAFEAAVRELKEETSLEHDELIQFFTFTEPDRDPRGRAVSIAHVGYVNIDEVTVEAADDAAEVGWFDVSELPDLAFDHLDIVTMALMFLLQMEAVFGIAESE